MDPLPKQVRRLADERLEGVVAALVAGRDDFQDGYHLAVAVLDADAVGTAGIGVRLPLDDEPSPGRGCGDRQAAGRFSGPGARRPARLRVSTSGIGPPVC